VLALLAAGENPQDPRLAPAVDFLKKADIVGTYALGVRCQVLLLLPRNAGDQGADGARPQRLLA
jgi:hypothetical protein